MPDRYKWMRARGELGNFQDLLCVFMDNYGP